MAQYQKLLFPPIALLTSCLVALPASAGIKLSDEKSGTSVDLGGRLQFMTLFNDNNLKDNDIEYRVRRARFRLGITPHEWWQMFLQTEFSNEAGAGSGGDVRLIDAFITFKPRSAFQIIGGERMAPVSRQNLTSSGGLMAMDRPGITNYVLTWGMRGQTGLQTAILPGTRAGTVGDVSVRDLGITLFGHKSQSDDLHFKYYLGVSDGSTVRVGDNERISARAQLNFGDPEPGYFGLSTYLGKKKTLGFGIGYDSQDEIAVDSVTGTPVDYDFLTVDAFIERPLGGGSVTAEIGYNDLDLGNTANPLGSAVGTPLGGAAAANQAEGDGYYLQTGYFVNNLQPWFMYETWDSNGANNAGDWDAFRVGLSYFFKGHNANVKIGYESTTNDTPGQSDIDTLALGAYITF